MNDGAPNRDRVSFAGRRMPSMFDLRIVEIPPGCTRQYVEAEWADSLVTVEDGEVEIECLRGDRRRFVCGDVLWLVGLPLRALHNEGAGTVVLAAVSRRWPDVGPGAAALRAGNNGSAGPPRATN